MLMLPIVVWANSEWPSNQQTKLVEERKSQFPTATYNVDVDWFEPLEVVKGRPGGGLPKSALSNPAYSKAIALGEKHHSYALLFWQDGALRIEKYWQGFDKTTLFDTASMNKPVVALLLGVAMQEGLIDSVDDPLSKYLPELKNTKIGSAPLRSLLEMASGIKTPLFEDNPANTYWQTYFGDDLVKAIAHWPVPQQPYTQFLYANANTQYLGWVIERVTKKRYADYLSEKLWQPIGAGDGRVWLDHQEGSARMACCLQASAEDWLRVGLVVLNKGKVNAQLIMPADWIKRMTAPSLTNPNYGWQIWRGSPHNPKRTYGPDIPAVIPAKEPFTANDVVYFEGSGGQRVYISQAKKAVIVRIGKPS